MIAESLGCDVTPGHARATHRRPVPGANPPTVLPFPPRGDASAMDDDEAALVERARTHDASAWSVLYRRHHAALFRHVLYLVGRSNVAEDLTQETFARALVSLPSFVGRSSFTTWLHGIALNLVRTNYRSHERATRAQDQLSRIHATHGAFVEPEGELADQHRTRVLYAMLDKLTAPLREAFVLRYVHGMTAAEAATALGIEPGAVRVRAHRAREQLEAEVARLHAAAVAKAAAAGEEPTS